MSSQCLNKLRFTVIFLYLIIYTHIGENVFAQRQVICGRAINEVLASFCVNGFNKRIKRCLETNYEAQKTPPTFGGSWYNHLKIVLKKLESELQESPPDIIKLDLTEYKREKGDKGDFVRKRRHVNYVTSKGIADECCIDGCDFAEIIKYCK